LYGAKGSKTLFLEKRRTSERYAGLVFMQISAGTEIVLLKEMFFMDSMICMFNKNTKLNVAGKI
jgi:hypothetical protein